MSSSATTAKRTSTVPPASAGPKPPVSFSSSVTIAELAVLTGTYPVTIGSESVIHPRARLESLSGSITIGRRCVIHERTKIGYMGPEGKVVLDEDNRAVVLGDYVTVEVGAVLEASGTIVGEGTVVGVGSRIGSGAVIGKYCTITPESEVPSGATIPDYTVVYGDNKQRTDRRGVAALMMKAQAQQIAVLRTKIPSNPAKFQ